MKMATMLVDSLASDWRPEQYHDTYTEELRKRIKAKNAGKKIVEEDTSAPKAEVLDLMAALERSVQSTRAGKRSAGKRSAGRRGAARPVRARKGRHAAAGIGTREEAAEDATCQRRNAAKRTKRVRRQARTPATGSIGIGRNAISTARRNRRVRRRPRRATVIGSWSNGIGRGASTTTSASKPTAC